MGINMIGIRIYPNKDGWLDPQAIDQPGCYGRCTHPSVISKRTGWWMVTTPDGRVGSLNPEIHKVIEHEDGTITVTPSLDMSVRRPGGWHGWLTKGYFRSV